VLCHYQYREIGSGMFGQFLIERALDEARSHQFRPIG